MAARYYNVCLGLILVCLNVQVGKPSGTIEIEFHKFRLTNQEDRCCSCWPLQEKCDIYFKICLTISQGPHCMFDPIIKGVYEDRAEIEFRGDRLSLALPKRSFSVRIIIKDDDGLWIDQYIDTVQVFMDDLIPTQNGHKGNYSSYTLKGDNSVLELNVRAHCDKGFYGERCRHRCKVNAEGGHTCEDTVKGYPTCSNDEYVITLKGVVDEANLQDLRTGLVDIVRELGHVQGDIHVQVSTKVDEIDPGVRGTIVTFCMSQTRGPLKLETIKELFETQDDKLLNSYLPFDLFRRKEMRKRPLDNQDGDNKMSWVSKHWYVILIVIIVVIIVVVVCVVVFLIVKKRRRLQSEEHFWRCHSGQSKRSKFDIGFINPFYGKKRRPSDVLDESRRDRPISCVSDVTCQSYGSENHYEDMDNLPNPLA